MAHSEEPRFSWLHSGREGLACMATAITNAQHSVALEMYILQDGDVGTRFRSALAEAARRGVRVRVLIDAFGSFELPANYFDPVIEAGGDCRWFNPIELRRLPYRDHRKLLIVDDQVAYLGGFNIGKDYDGDGITRGWHDLGMTVRGEVVAKLTEAFHVMFGAASFKHRRLARFRRHLQPQRASVKGATLHLLSPGRGPSIVRDAMVADMRKARRIHFTTAYFLPPRVLRRAMNSAARRGAEVQLLLPGWSDVKLAQYAARGQYGSLLKAGVQIFEYQPAILHSKRYLADSVAYVGSANLDLRSLRINYELLLRIEDGAFAEEGHARFAADLGRSRCVSLEAWRQRPWWHRWIERLASMILVRIDLYFAMRQLVRIRVEDAPLPSRSQRSISAQQG